MREPASSSPRPDPGTEEALICVDVPNSCEQFLIEQSSFDREFSSMKEFCEFFRFNRQGLRPGAGEPDPMTEIAKFQAAESSWIDKP